MATKLRKLRINRVALVDCGANQEAHIEIFKRNDEVDNVEKYGDPNSLEGKVSTIRRAFEEMMNGGDSYEGKQYCWVDEVYDSYLVYKKGIEIFKIDYKEDSKGNLTFGEPLKVQPVITYKPIKKGNKVTDVVTDETDELAEALAKIATLESTINELTELAKTDDKSDEPTEDEILKSLPESVRKRLADADKDRERIAKLEDDANRTSFEKKASTDFSNIADSKELGDTLMRIHKACVSADDVKAFNALEVILKGVNARADITKEIGTANDSLGTGSDSVGVNKVRELAELEQEKDPSLTRAQAVAKVLSKNPKLYTEARS